MDGTAAYGSDPFAYDSEKALAAVPKREMTREDDAVRLLRDEREQLNLLMEQQPSERTHSNFTRRDRIDQRLAQLTRPSDDLTRKPTAYDLRLRQAHRLHREQVSAAEIASRMGVSLVSVRKYLAAPSESRATKPSEMHSTTLSGERAGVPSSSRKNALRERVRTLRDAGLVRSAIADRLGKSDRTVGRYLAELEHAA